METGRFHPAFSLRDLILFRSRAGQAFKYFIPLYSPAFSKGIGNNAGNM